MSEYAREITQELHLSAGKHRARRLAFMSFAACLQFVFLKRLGGSTLGRHQGQHRPRDGPRPPALTRLQNPHVDVVRGQAAHRRRGGRRACPRFGRHELQVIHQCMHRIILAACNRPPREQYSRSRCCACACRVAHFQLLGSSKLGESSQEGQKLSQVGVLRSVRMR
jgi:hypothetical protein